MNSGAFDEAAFDFLVSDEGGANVAAAYPPDRPPGPRGGPARASGKPPGKNKKNPNPNIEAGPNPK
ncbi:hypothetical protein GSH05_26425, partial [Burkholderia pseudomallei]|nr:hypothetical protein [Burkholderia pseudomallei]